MSLFASYVSSATSDTRPCEARNRRMRAVQKIEVNYQEPFLSSYSSQIGFENVHVPVKTTSAPLGSANSATVHGLPLSDSVLNILMYVAV